MYSGVEVSAARCFSSEKAAPVRGEMSVAPVSLTSESSPGRMLAPPGPCRSLSDQLIWTSSPVSVFR